MFVFEIEKNDVEENAFESLENLSFLHFVKQLSQTFFYQYFNRLSLFESFRKVIEIICNEATKESCKQDGFIPDPRDFDLPEDFIYIENEWGSLFYKHLGNVTRMDGKTICSSFGSSVHLPIPRFREEVKFYQAHFGFNSRHDNDFKGS